MNIIVIILLSFFFFQPSKVLSELRIDITKGNLDPIPIAILEFNSKSEKEINLSKNINKVISNNLERSGLFSVLSKRIFLREKISFNKKPEFSDWKLITAQGLVHGRLKLNGDKLSIEFRLLWDVFFLQQMVAQQLITEEGNWRRISHVISDIIYQRITGESGYFDSRIV